MSYMTHAGHDTDRFEQEGSDAPGHPVDLWVREQLFEEDVRAVLNMMRPHRRQRLMGWSEYRTGSSHVRVTVSWDKEFAPQAQSEPLVVPRMADVLETLLIGSSKESGDLPPAEEFAHYRQVVRELYRRIDDMEACYT